MNKKTVTIRRDILLEALSELKKKGLTTVRNKLLLAIPLRFFKGGTHLWWERSDLEAREDIKYGRVTTIRSHKELDKFFKNLSS